MSENTTPEPAPLSKESLKSLLLLTDYTFEGAALAPEQARAAATGYGWSVLPHDNGGFSAQRGQYQMIVTFAPDGSFRHASVQKGLDGLAEFLMENSVIPVLARHGSPERPVGSEEKTA